ncbi:MAG TPA: GNAT family protein [Streptosporangiaceae bacterium]|jgi:RimJ/RimL family protein N-acetyltransferase
MAAAISFAEKPTLEGDLVLLRPVRRADAAGLDAFHEESLRLTGSHRRATFEDLEAWYASRADHDDRLDLSIIERASGGWAGEVVLNELDPDNLSCGFRIGLVGPEYYGRGLGTEATRLVLGHAFETVGLHRIELTVFAFNPRARRVYDKVGFVFEGTRRQALRWDGEWVDADIMGILADEWSRHRGYPESRSTR